MIRPSDLRQILADHDRYWSGRHAEMRRLRLLYMMRYWDRKTALPRHILVELSRGYEFVEGHTASLFVKDPSVKVSKGIRGKGDPTLTEAVSNQYLRASRKMFERATRLARSYPFACLKLAPCAADDALDRSEMEPVGPWDILVDDTAATWEKQRWIGHRYHLPLNEAREKFGAKRFAKRSFQRYLDLSVTPSAEDERPEDSGGLEDYILVIELYDLVDNRLLFWSPDYLEGRRWLSKGIELEVGDDSTPEVYTEIPFEPAGGRLVVPIIPLMLSEDPDEPCRGYSSLRRVYDQACEANIIRTCQANGVRRASRQWLSPGGMLDEEAKGKLAQGVDGEIIDVDLSPGQRIEDALHPVPHTPLPAELERYIRAVDDDFSRGTLTAPFTRGEATKATATEITALAAYSATEIGRMARERDEVISRVAQAYVVMLATIMQDSQLVVLHRRVQTLRPDDLTGDFGFHAHDSGSTPISDAVKKQELLNLVPVLQELGVPTDKILEQLVRAYDLPDTFLPMGGTPPATAVPPPAGAMPPVGVPPADGLPGMGVAPGMGPSASRVGGVLPPGGVV